MSEEKRKEFLMEAEREPTRGEIAALAVEADFENLRAWRNNEWSYIVLSVSIESIDEDGEATEIEIDHLGGVESFGDYWREQAAEMGQNLISNYLTEQAEKAEWEARDVVTV